MRDMSSVSWPAVWVALLVLTTASAAATPLQKPGARGGVKGPDSFAAIRQRANDARTAGRLEEALDLYRQAIKLRPAWAEGHWYLGTTYYEIEKYPECRDAFGAVVRLQTGNGAAWAFKGLCEFQLKKYREALHDLNKAQGLGVGDPKLIQVSRYHRAILLTRFEEYERALQAFAEFVREGNNTPMLIDGMGLAVLRLPYLPDELPAEKRDVVLLAGRTMLLTGSNNAAAGKAFEELVGRYPQTPNVHYLYGVYLLHERPDEALDEFNEELRVSPDHARAMVQMAQEWLKRGDLDAAIRWAGRAVQLAPRNFVCRRVLGQIKLELDDVAGAVSELETAAKLEPESPSVHYALARAYQRAGRAADAKRERAEFSRLDRLRQQQRRGIDAVDDPPK
jgi:tetratricopeptide (TPR) repeat protein